MPPGSAARRRSQPRPRANRLGSYYSTGESPMYFDPRDKEYPFKHDPLTTLVVPRPIGWISTLTRSGLVNLAPYSFFNAVASRPPFVMFASAGRKHSQINAEESGEFVHNLVVWDLREQMNITSADVGPDVSEAELAGLE